MELLTQPFDIEKERIYCSNCGQQCVPMGHIMSKFLLCPTHGEFTIAPVVIMVDGQWMIEHRDQTAKAMWETCRGFNELQKVEGGPDR